MISKSELESLAKKLMFEMNDDEYETLKKEFDVILKQMDLIGNIKGIDKVEPMTFPFDLELNDDYLREDVYNNEIDFDDMSFLSSNFCSFNSFNALFDALNSTGSVIIWKANRVSSNIIPISINLYEQNAPIAIARYPSLVQSL